MGPRRTAIVPNVIWGTAIASIIPSQLVACGGSSSEPGAAGSGDHAGSVSHAGNAGHESGGAAGKDEGYAGFIVLAIASFGGAGFPSVAGGGSGGTEVMMAGSGGSSAGLGGSSAGVGGSAAGSGGKKSNGEGGFFIVLAAAAFGGKNQQ